jgi:hypothetical protein
MERSCECHLSLQMMLKNMKEVQNNTDYTYKEILESITSYMVQVPTPGKSKVENFMERDMNCRKCTKIFLGNQLINVKNQY